MTIRELMLEVEREIEAGKQSGAWEFDYHAEMEEVERYLCKLGAEEAPVEDAAETVEGEPVAEIAEVEEVAAAEDCEAEASSEVIESIPEVCEELDEADEKLFSEKEKGLLFGLMKGVREAAVVETQLLYREIISKKPTSPTDWGKLRRKYFPGRSARSLIKKFNRVGAVEWDEDMKHDVVWL